jgi:hypothetical protein
MVLMAQTQYFGWALQAIAVRAKVLFLGQITSGILRGHAIIFCSSRYEAAMPLFLLKKVHRWGLGVDIGPV